jgi:hypothetical protein
MKTFVLLSLALLLFSGYVSAQESVSVDMPNNLGYMEEFDAVFQVGDKEVREKANYITFTDYCSLVSWKDKTLMKSGSDDMTPNYNHEETKEYTGVVLSPWREEKNCTIEFKFYKTELLGPEMPKSFIGHSTTTWKEGKPTYWRFDELAVVKKNVRIHPTEIVVNLPDGYNYRTENTFPFIGSAYSIHEQPSTCSTSECFQQYGVYYGIRNKGFFGKEDYDGTKTFRQIFDEDMDKRGTAWQVPTETVDAYVLSALGATEGYYRKRVEVLKFATFDPVTLDIEFLINKKDYYIYYTAHWSKNAAKGKGEEAIEAQIDVEKKTLSSLMFRAHKDHLLAATEPEKPTEKTIRLEGVIKDTDNKTMPYIEVNIVAQKNNITTHTDKDGKYSATLTKIKFEAGKNETGANITVKYSYLRDGKNYFTVTYDGPIKYVKAIRLKNNSNSATEDILMNGHVSPDESTDTGHTSYMKHYSVIYTYTADVADFALTELGANIDYKLPVEVVPYTSQGTLYRLGTSSVEINRTDSDYSSSNKPDNREYHEFCHHILFSQWNGDNIRFPGDNNHDGYINNNTGDSYTEGFAEFCSMACSKYKGDPKPELYASFGNFEYNYKAWSHRGKYEEIAIAGILWDLYDDHNDASDTVSLPLKDIWAVLKVKRTDFYEYYKALKAAFPASSDGIDKIFISHGFFADTHIGNKSYDRGEAYKDANGNKSYDAGETFVDYGTIEGLNHPWMQYEGGEVIGRATNYERPNRGQAVKLDDAYIKATDLNVKTYKILVQPKNSADGAAFEYGTEAVNGLIYVAPLPEDMDADIIIKTDSREYTSAKEYKITNQEYMNKYYSKPEGQKYFDSYNFEAKSTGVKEETEVVPSPQSTPSTGGQGEIVDDSKEYAGSNTGTVPTNKETTPTNTDTGESSTGISSNTILGIAGIGVIGIGLLIFGAIFLLVIFLVLKKKK